MFIYLLFPGQFYLHQFQKNTTHSCPNQENLLFPQGTRSSQETQRAAKHLLTDIISDLQEQIAELMAIIEQMNRDQQSALKLLSKDLDLRCSNMKQKFETESR